MELFGAIITGLISFAFNVILVILGVAFTIFLYFILAMVISFIWQMTHIKSYLYVNEKFKKLFKRKN